MDVRELRDELIRQKRMKSDDGIYHWTQIQFAYHSSRMEGSTVSAAQTEMIYDTGTILTDESELIRVDDILETENHFRLFDYMLDTLREPLSENMILKMHSILKRGTADERNPRMNTGNYKKLSDQIGTFNPVKTVPPQLAQKAVLKLLGAYRALEKVSFENIMEFHVQFERIHPFSDGNGRIGRILMFRECLKNEIFPFIVLEQEKAFYLRGLKEYSHEPGDLKDTLLHFQDIYSEVWQQMMTDETKNCPKDGSVFEELEDFEFSR